MKLATTCLIALSLSACKSEPKAISIALSGMQGQEFLRTACVPLALDAERMRKTNDKDQFTFTDSKYLPCLHEHDLMYREVEGKFLTAFANNPECHGMQILQGHYEPDSETTDEAKRQFSAAPWRLSLVLVPSGPTGEISLANSGWILDPNKLSGSLANLDSAASHICRIAKGQGSEVQR